METADERGSYCGDGKILKEAKALEKARKNWIDVARALAMLFVIFGHVGNELIANNISADGAYLFILKFINPIKVPLFFAVSGYLFSDKNDDTRYFFTKLLRQRMIPYAFWASFMGIVAFLMDYARSGFNKSKVISLLCSEYIIPFFRGNLIWFIPCLIVAEMLFFAVKKASKGNLYALSVLSLLMTAAGYLLSSDSAVKPWKFDTALTCVQFMALGYVIKKLSGRIKINLRISAVLFSAVYIFLTVLFGSLKCGVSVDVNMGRYFNPAGFTLLSFIGIGAVFCISHFLEKEKALLFIGQNTFVYFVWHMYAAKAVTVVLCKFSFMSHLAMTVRVIVITLLSCFASAAVALVVNRWLGFSVGRKNSGRI